MGDLALHYLQSRENMTLFLMMETQVRMALAGVMGSPPLVEKSMHVLIWRNSCSMGVGVTRET